MKKIDFNKAPFSRSLFVSLLTASLLTGCDGSSSSSSSSDSDSSGGDGLPEGLLLNFVDANSAGYVSYDTDTGKTTDLNELAASSGESSIQNLEITDTSKIGHFFHWPDFREVRGEEVTDMKYLLMVPDYTYMSGAEIDSDQFVQLVHMHGEDFGAHSADEFADPVEGSQKADGLARLNAFVTEQDELEDEVSGALLTEGQTLCRAFVDPYIKFELEHEEEEGHEEEGHEHGELVHFGLTDSGRIYFFEENEETETLESTQSFVALTDVVTISDCSRTTIARVSEDGIIVFIPDSQKLYLVDNHGAEWHEHQNWDLSDILPDGFHADLMSVIGEGGEHEDHDHE